MFRITIDESTKTIHREKQEKWLNANKTKIMIEFLDFLCSFLIWKKRIRNAPVFHPRGPL